MAIADTIAKLLAHADSASVIGNLAEAEAFADKAMRLMRKHELSMTDIERERRDKDEPIDTEIIDAVPGQNRNGYPDMWRGYLLDAIAKGMFCRMLNCRRNKFMVIGKKSHRETVVRLYNFLATEAVRLCEKAMPGYYASDDLRRRVLTMWGGSERTARANAVKQFKNGFMTGFATAIRERMRATKNELEQGETASETAIVLRNDRAVEAAFAEKSKGTPRKSTAKLGLDGYLAGHAAGSVAPLTTHALA
jgi:hypothetical protein